MKISIYELLGMIKDGKAPKKIKYGDKIYSFKDFLYKLEPSCLYPHIVTDDYVLYCNEINKYILNNYKIYDNINDEVEILEEKKIPEKLYFHDLENITKNEKILVYKINSILDYLESKEKGE